MSLIIDLVFAFIVVVPLLALGAGLIWIAQTHRRAEREAVLRDVRARVRVIDLDEVLREKARREPAAQANDAGGGIEMELCQMDGPPGPGICLGGALPLRGDERLIGRGDT